MGPMASSVEDINLMQKSDYVNSSPHQTQSSLHKLLKSQEAAKNASQMEASILSSTSSNSCLASLITCGSSSNGAQNSEFSSSGTGNSGSDEAKRNSFNFQKSVISKRRTNASDSHHVKHNMSHSLISELLGLMNVQETELAHRLLADYHQTLISQQDSKNSPELEANAEANNEGQERLPSAANHELVTDTENLLKKSLLISFNNRLKTAEHADFVRAYKKKHSDGSRTRHKEHSSILDQTNFDPNDEINTGSSNNHSPDYVNASVFIRDELKGRERPSSLTSSITTTVTDNDSNATFRVISLDENGQGQARLPYSCSFDPQLETHKIRALQLRKIGNASDAAKTKSGASSGSNGSKRSKVVVKLPMTQNQQHLASQSVCEYSLSSSSGKRSTSDSSSAIDEVAAHLQNILATLPPDSATGLLSALLREHSERRGRGNRCGLPTQYENTDSILSIVSTSNAAEQGGEEELSTAMSSSLDGETTGLDPCVGEEAANTSAQGYFEGHSEMEENTYVTMHPDETTIQDETLDRDQKNEAFNSEMKYLNKPRFLRGHSEDCILNYRVQQPSAAEYEDDTGRTQDGSNLYLSVYMNSEAQDLLPQRVDKQLGLSNQVNMSKQPDVHFTKIQPIALPIKGTNLNPKESQNKQQKAIFRRGASLEPNYNSLKQDPKSPIRIISEGKGPKGGNTANLFAKRIIQTNVQSPTSNHAMKSAPGQLNCTLSYAQCSEDGMGTIIR
ncbi:hypothetical protein Ciccas_009228 [Cichlidogyrus casuarinus]|uniref:Uncharacterized protein n=1 Tax=Cichlidogyrus casuarinus TaxID=1844966 RepID=A0ABD2PXM7_9PLAT